MSRKFCFLSVAACASALLCTPTTSFAHAPTVPSPSAVALHRIVRLAATAAPRRVSPRVRGVRPDPVARASRPRIVGGYGAVQSDWPFMGLVLHFDTNGNPDFSCTGTVVATNVVLTAGHCAVDEVTGVALDPSGFAVVTGTVDWTNTAQRQISPVSRVIVDPYYDSLSDESDAALLVLSKPTTAPDIPLATSADTYLEQGGTDALIAGWGETYSGDPLLQTYLQWAPTVVQNSGYCSQFDPYFDSFSELCAVNPPDFLTGTCSGDSGGPLVGEDASDRLVEIGVITLGPTDCNTYTADYFTNVIPISSWAAGWIKAVAPPPPPAPSPPPTPSAPPPAGPSQPAPLPALTFSDAKLDVRQTLAGVLGPRFKPAHQYAAKCSRKSSTRITCAVNFWHGPNDYYGNVTIYYVSGRYGDAVWRDDYTLHWVSDQCYFHSGHRQTCTTHTRRGTW
jgi:Trypsin